MQICLTGASKGIGFALCKKLLEDGHTVWAAARHTETLMELQAQYPTTLVIRTIDVSVENDVTQWASELRTSGTLPDALILNASVQEDDLKESYDHTVGEKMLRTNLDGTLRCIAAFHPLFQKNGHGKILAIASTVALRPSMRSAAYSASKAGIAMAMRTLRLHYGSSPVEFKTAYLGPIATEMWEGKASPLDPTSESAANALAQFLKSNRTTLYYPALSTLLLRITLWLPDRFFSALSKRILH